MENVNELSQEVEKFDLEELELEDLDISISSFADRT